MTDFQRRAAALLGDDDPIEVLRATPVRLAELVEAMPPEVLDSPYAPGKWRRRDVVAHLADVELAFGWRFRRTVAAPGTELASFDQDVWAERYARLDPTLALEAFRALRSWNLAWLTTLTLQDWLAEGVHEGRGPESVDVMVRYLAGHDLNHLAQLGAG
jgi:hypothetical protein